MTTPHGMLAERWREFRVRPSPAVAAASRDETERISSVYRQYEADPESVAKWDWGNRGNQWMALECRRKTHSLLFQTLATPLSECRILDIGCGTGYLLATVCEWGARPQHVLGIDLLPEHIDAARRTYPEIPFLCANAERLRLPDSSVDLVLVFTVFSSILDATMASNLAREIRRVLRDPSPSRPSSGGAVVWYDFRYNNPWNRNTRPMTKRRIRRLFAGFQGRLEPITLVPPIARRLSRFTDALYPILARVRPLRSHYLGRLAKLSPA